MHHVGKKEKNHSPFFLAGNSNALVFLKEVFMSAGTLSTFEEIKKAVTANFDEIEAAAREDLSDVVVDPGDDACIVVGRVYGYYSDESEEPGAEMYFVIGGEVDDEKLATTLQELRKRCDAAAEEFRALPCDEDDYDDAVSALTAHIVTLETSYQENALFILAGSGSSSLVEGMPKTFDAINDALFGVVPDDRADDGPVEAYYVLGNIFGVSENGLKGDADAAVED